MNSYHDLVIRFISQQGVAQCTMMGTPCLRYQGEFIAMMFEREDSLIIKVAATRVDEIISAGQGSEFKFTKKRFKEWVLIPREFEDKYPDYVDEALQYAKAKQGK